MKSKSNVATLDRGPRRDPTDVLIHVRFFPSAEIASIDARPARLSNFEWFTCLQEGASDHYETYAGGRGFFRIPRAKFDAILGRLEKAA